MKNGFDNIDKAIVDDLSSINIHGASYVSKKLGVSRFTVARRFRKLRKEGVFGFVPIDPKAIGCNVVAIIAMNIKKGEIKTVMQAMGEFKETKWVHSVAGRYDLIALTWFTTTEELFQFSEDKLKNLNGVISSETFICLP